MTLESPKEKLLGNSHSVKAHVHH
uniref:Uncharacterized protein n=1 Tax=Rhizophora mucronata TaxID=61149 RepID=A0A2P2K2H6_RHIMU